MKATLRLPYLIDRRRAHRSTHFNGAFTLVEVLVVVGLLALLIGMLLPVLGKVRSQSRCTACLGNLRQIAFAIREYATRYNDEIIPSSYAWTPGNPHNYTKTLYTDESWCNLLVNGGFLTAPDGWNKRTGGTELGPQINSVFHCPDGQNDIVETSALYNSTKVPSSRSDLAGAQCFRAYSRSSLTSVDTWYGLNGDNGQIIDHTKKGKPVTTGSQAANVGCPSRQQPDPTTNTFNFTGMMDLTQPASMVALYDGLAFDIRTNSNRMNARHNRMTQTNLAFYDGHAGTYNNNKLPNDVELTHCQTLFQSYPPPQNPMWLLGEQLPYDQMPQ